MPFGSQEGFLACYPLQMSFPLKGQTHFLFLDYVIGPVLELNSERYNNRPPKTMKEALLSQLLLIKQPEVPAQFQPLSSNPHAVVQRHRLLN